MDEIHAHLGGTWFAWVGGSEDDSAFYYRIHGPVIYVEFNHRIIVTLEDPTGLPTLTAQRQSAGKNASDNPE